MLLVRGLLLLLVFTNGGGVCVDASKGDTTWFFQSCLSACLTRQACAKQAVRIDLFALTCTQQCKYECMWAQERENRASSPPIKYQYFGKWPFLRLGGVQEPASTVFSLLNAYFHFRAYVWQSEKVFPPSAPRLLNWIGRANCIIAIIAWLCSVTFHFRDVWLTERLDYHFAVAHMCMQLWFAISRIAISQVQSTILIAASGALIWTWFAMHVWYLNVVRFDYAYNMRATILVIVLQVVAWLVWAAYQVRRRAQSGQHIKVAWMTVRFQLALVACGLFEVFDFPPWLDVLDAHAIWHLCAIPLILYWYKIREEDGAQFAKEKQSI